MSNDKANAAYHPQTPAAPQGWDRADSTEWAPVPATGAAPHQQQNVVVNVTQPARGTNHVLHLLLTVFTGGLWLPVWLVLAIKNRRR